MELNTAEATHNIDTLIEPVRVAILLGAEIPVIEGSYGFVLVVTYKEDLSSRCLGIFATEEEAYKYLVSDLIEDRAFGNSPWLEDTFPDLSFNSDAFNEKTQRYEAYFKQLTYLEILSIWQREWSDGSNFFYDITGAVVKPAPVALWKE